MEPETRLARLERLRDSQDAWLRGGEVPAREFAALSREYRLTLAEIAELNPEEKAGDGIDEIAARRSARRPGPSAHSHSADRSS
jgi:hypothetical protein